MTYIATFHTHFGAMTFLRRLEAMGDDQAEMVPAPRKLSVSCGSAVRFSFPFDEGTMTDDDTEAVYLDDQGSYTRLFYND